MTSHEPQRTTAMHGWPTLAAVSMIGDLEPEDAYDASDRLEARLSVLVRIVEAYEADTDTEHRARRRAEVCRLVGDLLVELGDWHGEARALRERVEV